MSTRYLGGIIRKTPLALDPALGNAANGVFTMNQYMQAVKDGTWPGFDQYFNQTVLSLHGNGTNGDQNNTFLDSSSNNFTITRNGNTTQGTFSPFSGPNGYWSNFFDNNGDFLTGASNSAYNFSGDFTIEAWVYYDKSSGNNTIIDTRNLDSLSAYHFNINNAKLDFLFRSSGTTRITSSASVPLQSWNHVAVSRSGSTIRLFINGVQDGSVVDSATITAQSFPSIGGGRAGGTNTVNGYYFSGYISNLRILNGTGYSTMTVPTAPLTAITNTSLLTCQSNRFVDNSTNAFAITRNGDVRVTPFSPFAPSAAYSAGTNGGSGYFDGSGDFLTLGGQNEFAFGTGDFSIEFWLYGNSVSDINPIDFRPTSTNGLYPNIYLSNGTVYYFVNNSNVITSSSVISANTWNHIAVTRSGTSTKLWINGTQSGSTYTDSTNYIVGANRPIIGARGFDTTAGNLNGYISGVRIVKGSAVYTSAFTPPTAPLTAISNTQLLLNFTNAGIIDNTGKNNLETVGNAQIDTTTKKYGTGSLEFDGTGDYLVPSGDVNNFAFGSGDFTIECWLYLNNVTGIKVVYEGRPTGGSGATPTIYMNGASLRYFANGADRITGANLSATTWYHIAVTRSGTSTKLFVDGTQSGSTYTDSTVYTNSASRPLIGVGEDLGNALNGYIDDLRITKGVARYTANFTPQTSQWQDQ